jgi:hypothetical protein
MKQFFKGNYILFGLLVLLSTNSMYCQLKCKLIDEMRMGEYRILKFVKEQDTLVIIKKDIVSTKKIQNRIEEIVGGKFGTKISRLKVNEKIIWFYFKTETKTGLINTGEFSPRNAEETIYTYRSFPILLESFNGK